MKNHAIFSSTQGQNICKRLWIFVFRKNVGKNIKKKLGSYYSQKLQGHDKQSSTEALKTTSASKRAIQETSETTAI